MTLVLNCLTHDCLFQVSDRRLVRLHDLEILEDHANKNIFYCGSLAFSYTGLATIEGKRTDDWLLEILPASFAEALTTIRDRATQAFRQVNLPSWMKRHAFVAVGWISLDRDGPRLPTLVLVSNFHSPTGKVLGVTADEFSISVAPLPQNMTYAVKSVGQPVAQSVLKELDRDISRCIKKGTGPAPILRHLVIAARKMAGLNRAIGRNLLALSFPKEAAGKSEIALGAGLDKDNSFLCVNAESSDFSAYPPFMKCGGAIFAHNVIQELHIYPPLQRW